MGAFYGSIQVRSNQRDAVVAAVESVARQRGIKCLVSPVLNEWIGIYPEGHGQDDQFGAAVAAQLSDVVVHMLVHDSDVMAYWLWRNHQLVDSYWSRPGYFGEKDRPKQEEMAGRPQEFQFLIGDKIDRLAEILRRDADDLPLEEERLDGFAKLLGISNALNAYEYMKEGDAADRKGWRKFTEVPIIAVIAENKKKRNDRNAATKERRLLENDGLLLLRDERQETMPKGCAVGAGFIVAWPDYRAHTASIDFYRDPWRNPIPSGLETPPHINAVVSDAAGRRVAMAVGDRIRVWDSSNEAWNVVADVSEADLAIGLAISSDGSTIAHSSRQEVVLTTIAQQQTLVRVAGRSTQHMAFHPSGDWIVVSGSTLGLISARQEPHWRDLFVGGKDVSASWADAIVRLQMRNVDKDALERQQRAAIDAIRTKLQKMITHAKKGASTEKRLDEVRLLEEFRPKLEKQLQEWTSRIVATKEGREPLVPSRAKEHVRCAGFSRDGQWLWCGTNVGLRIFRWESVPREPGFAMPKPVWQYVCPGPAALGFSGDVYAIAEEADAAAIVFAGGTGRLYRFDLESGEAKELAKLPGVAGVYGLAMSSDGATLGVASS